MSGVIRKKAALNDSTPWIVKLSTGGRLMRGSQPDSFANFREANAAAERYNSSGAEGWAVAVRA